LVVNGAFALSVIVEEERRFEKALLLRRAYSKPELFSIGKELEIPYFKSFSNEWMIEEEEAAVTISTALDDEKLKNVFKKFKPRSWAVFRGIYYTLEDGKILIEGASKLIESGIQNIRARYGSRLVSVLTTLVRCGGKANIEELRRHAKAADVQQMMEELERRKVVVASYRGNRHQEWMILEESLPIVEVALGIKKRRKKIPQHIVIPPPEITIKEEPQVLDSLEEERQKIGEMEREFDEYLQDLLKYRLERTIRFGKEFGLDFLSRYLEEMFGSVLYFDSLLSITQQYGLANTEIVHEKGKTGRKTGWSLALFGDPGTGKSFSTRDMILGQPSVKIGAHGLPGRNRYCGGMTPARFIRIGQAYGSRTFNFIVPEFNDFFKYKGMVEPLKIAMEQGEIKYETHNETIGPYRFTSFFAVNYNVSIHAKGYEVTIQDPNFNAIEDRMLCRLHRLTKERFVEITRSQTKLALGTIDLMKDSQKIRDHLTLVYAIETGHPLVKQRFQSKPVMITPQVFDIIGKTRASILERIPQKVVKFSARLEDKALRFACAASLMDYFHDDLKFIPVGDTVLKHATQLYVEEASIRSKEAFEPEDVLREVFKD
jgi:hypothetical protein